VAKSFSFSQPPGTSNANATSVFYFEREKNVTDNLGDERGCINHVIIGQNLNAYQ
jgi:hypothetical protein